MFSDNENHNGKEWDRPETKSLMVVVLDTVRTRILTGELKPGSKINESDVASRLGISRSPVREAFRVLEREGLIVTLPRKGSYITDISLQDLRELFEIRVLLECYAIDSIKKRASESPEEIMSLIEELNSELLKGPDEFTVISGFHYNLIELSNNYRLIELYKILAVSLRRYQLIYLGKGGQRGISLKDHKTIVDILKGGNYTYAKKFLRNHIRYVEKITADKVKKILAV